jgi:hypothetical protein
VRKDRAHLRPSNIAPSVAPDVSSHLVSDKGSTVRATRAFAGKILQLADNSGLTWNYCHATVVVRVIFRRRKWSIKEREDETFDWGETIGMLRRNGRNGVFQRE